MGTDQVYQVQRGDNLWRIARKFNVSLEALQRANRLDQDSILQIGQKLLIPSTPTSPHPASPPSPAPISGRGEVGPSVSAASRGTTPTRPAAGERVFIYAVQPGDYLIKIARRFGLPLATLMAANGLQEDTLLQVGQKLVLPGVSAPPTPPSASPSSRIPQPVGPDPVEPFPREGRPRVERREGTAPSEEPAPPGWALASRETPVEVSASLPANPFPLAGIRSSGQALSPSVSLASREERKRKVAGAEPPPERVPVPSQAGPQPVPSRERTPARVTISPSFPRPGPAEEGRPDRPQLDRAASDSDPSRDVPRAALHRLSSPSTNLWPGSLSNASQRRTQPEQAEVFGPGGSAFDPRSERTKAEGPTPAALLGAAPPFPALVPGRPEAPTRPTDRAVACPPVRTENPLVLTEDSPAPSVAEVRMDSTQRLATRPASLEAAEAAALQAGAWSSPPSPRTKRAAVPQSVVEPPTAPANQPEEVEPVTNDPSDLPEAVYVGPDRVHLRKGPGTSHGSLKLLAPGTRLKVVGKYRHWWKVQTPQGPIGYVAGWVVSQEPLQKVPPATSNREARRGFILEARVPIREQPSVGAKPIAFGVRGSPVDILEESNGWYRVRFANGMKGWVASWKVRSAPEPEEARSGEPLIRTAMRYLGVPYRRGGASSRGLDCSGLIYVVCRAHGIELPRSSRGMYGRGKPVDRSDLQPGDLLFFNTNGRGVSHVGMYIGHGKFIHATSRGRDVCVSHLSEEYYARRYVGARRIQ